MLLLGLSAAKRKRIIIIGKLVFGRGEFVCHDVEFVSLFIIDRSDAGKIEGLCGKEEQRGDGEELE